jgi:hypothetical protein
MTFLVIAATVGLRDQRVKPEHQADAEERRSVINSVAQGDSADGGGAEFAHHDGVHHALGHPPQLA